MKQETMQNYGLADAAIIRYDGTIALAPADGVLEADLRIAIPATKSSRLSFILAASLGEADITGREVVSVSVTPQQTFGRSVNAYTIDLNPAVDASEHIVNFRYRGKLIPDDSPLAINAISEQRVELTADSFWFPLETSFETKIDASLAVDIEGDWIGVAPGSFTRADNRFLLDQDVGGTDISLALLPDPVIHQVGAYTVYDARPSPRENIEGVVAALEVCSRFLNELAGPEDQLPDAHIMVFSRDSVGYSRRTIIALSDPANSDDVSLTQFVCHELAHNWSRANSSTPEQWHNEGLADTIANLALRETFGPRVYEARLARYREMLLSEEAPLGPIWTSSLTDRASDLVAYRAAPLAFASLEQRLGSAQFRSFVRRLMNDKVAHTPRLLSILEEVANLDQRRWFENVLAQEARGLGEAPTD
ncbi:gluzincin family metallopeptidase [Aurantiacibacter sediminis]|uniref:Peptidase M1 membrane alanine aminopeptidase domain-containing protein n=1 Tax=Aurantiacibacter sediminis TaxID=2793064 RepID=A0ABS0N2C8_9SPHN|nr:hypothetical protein [Aurantiacibacter sediminis]MBH5322130.1 hypothetical protein [Aurantiacibacter sediminis]